MFTAVRGKRDTYPALERATEYASRIIGKVEGGDDEFVALIRTEREGSCKFNAQSQADRYRSFSNGWRIVGPFETTQEIDNQDDFYGVTISLERV